MHTKLSKYLYKGVSMKQFSTLSLCSEIHRSLTELQYQTMTPVQELTIPLLLDHQSLIVKAETGSGKTAAYGIPLLEHLTWIENKPQALIIAPNRELVIQIAEDLNQIGRYKRMKALPIYGRASIKEQQLALKQKNHIITATPGRLMDLIERQSISLEKLEYLILDEADELLREEFFRQLASVFEQIPTSCTIALYSATLNEHITQIPNLHHAAFTTVDATNMVQLKIEEQTYAVTEREKLTALQTLLSFHPNQGGIIFTNTKTSAEKIYRFLSKLDISVAYMHSDLEQRHRIRNMNAFKSGFYRYLVTTDLNARGIDVDGIDLVLNYDLPTTPANYTHRIGRIGRNGRCGVALNLVTPDQELYLRRIEKLIGRTLDFSEFPASNLSTPPTDTTKELVKREKKGTFVGTDITKLYINGGKRKKLRAADIVGTICSIPTITPEDIGIIEIKENETYVEILNNKANITLLGLRERNIKGRKYKVHIAKSKNIF